MQINSPGFGPCAGMNGRNSIIGLRMKYGMPGKSNIMSKF